MKAMKFNGGIAGTTVVLVDATSLGNKKAINKKLNVFKTGSRSTHEICWLDDRVQVIESSGISIDPLYTEGANSQIKVKIISFRFLSYFLLDFETYLIVNPALNFLPYFLYKIFFTAFSVLVA